MIASTSRLPTILALSRGFATTSRTLAKAPLAPTANISTPIELLTKIGRGAEKRLATQAESWESLNGAWMGNGEDIKKSGLSVRDRRYVLWAFSRYSQGDAIDSFLSGPRVAKKFRGLSSLSTSFTAPSTSLLTNLPHTAA